jgi:hypothetical protein
MKQKTYTKAQVKRLIREIAKATQGSDKTSEHFAALLSAMRGPDDNDLTLKDATTCVIRTRLKWRCGSWGQNRPLKLVLEHRKNAESHHFRTHIYLAVQALEYFGYGDKQDTGGKA